MVGYTGGVNIADKYINEKKMFGVWKDVGIRLAGEAVTQLTSIFLADFELNRKGEVPSFAPYFWNAPFVENEGYVVPFGDGPGPIFKHRVAKIMLMNMSRVLFMPRFTFQMMSTELWVPSIWITAVWCIISRMAYGCTSMRC